MTKHHSTIFLILFLLTLGLFLLDLAWGSISISLQEIISIFLQSSNDTLSVAGLMMQTLFRNPLADPYILGVSSGASLGVALVMMTAAVLPIAFVSSGWAIILAAIIGASIVLILVVGVSFKVNNAVSLLIVGIMFGTIAGSLVSVLQNFSNPDAVKLFLMWTFGSLSAVTWNYMWVLLPVVMVGLSLSFYLQKKLDGLLLGENYARGLGISIAQTRFWIVLSTGLLAGGVTAFTGPIAFVGVAIPHIARGIFRSSSHKVLLPACVLLGASLLLVCDIISQIPTYTLPINTISALFGAPIIIWIILKRKKS